MKIKRFLISLLAGFFRSIAYLGRTLFKRFGFLKQFSFFIGKLGFRFFIFPLYKLFYFIKHKATNIYSPTKSKVFHLLNKNYLIHAVVILFAFVILINSISAQELREETFGEKTLVYSLVTKEVYEELTEETQAESYQAKILSYLDTSASVGTQKTISETALPEDETILTEISTITEGGSALVKPNIIQPITQAEAQKFQQEAEQKRTNITKYTVQDGETIFSIAKKFNVSTETLLWQNNLGTNSLIQPGQTLEILPVSGLTHKVARGDTIGAIANKYDISADEIVSYNNLPNDSSIRIGQQLIIPGAKLAAPSRYASTSTPQVAPISSLLAPPSAKVTGAGMLWPTSVRRISQYFSWRHTGLDIAGPTGTPIYAAEAGTVELSGWTNGYGNNIIINHGNGIKTRYAHHSKLYVSVGDRVVKGQTIAAMGSTGWSTGPHIHFEVIVSGSKKNPLSYIK